MELADRGGLRRERAPGADGVSAVRLKRASPLYYRPAKAAAEGDTASVTDLTKVRRR